MSEKVQELLERNNTQDLKEDYSVIITKALEKYLDEVECKKGKLLSS